MLLRLLNVNLEIRLRSNIPPTDRENLESPINNDNLEISAPRIRLRPNIQAAEANDVLENLENLESPIADDILEIPANKPKPRIRLTMVNNNIDQSWTVAEIAERAAPDSWKQVFEDSKNEIKTISEVLIKDELKHGLPFYPLKKHLLPLSNIPR